MCDVKSECINFKCALQKLYLSKTTNIADTALFAEHPQIFNKIS